MAKRTRLRLRMRKGDKLLHGKLLITAIKGQNLSLLIEAEDGERCAFIPAPKEIPKQIEARS